MLRRKHDFYKALRAWDITQIDDMNVLTNVTPKLFQDNLTNLDLSKEFDFHAEGASRLAEKNYFRMSSGCYENICVKMSADFLVLGVAKKCNFP